MFSHVYYRMTDLDFKGLVWHFENVLVVKI